MNKLIVFTIVLLTLVHAAAHSATTQLTPALPFQAIFSDLSRQYELSQEQKQSMVMIVVGELPTVSEIAFEMISNRQKILSLTEYSEDYDKQEMAELARLQGTLVTDLILWKEALKKRLKGVLEENQKNFVNDFVNTYVASKILAFSEDLTEEIE